MVAPSQVGSFLEAVKNSITEEEILLYVHLPFCSSECLFCNSFPSKPMGWSRRTTYNHWFEKSLFLPSRSLYRKESEVHLLRREETEHITNRDLELIINTIRSCITLAENCNITVEAQPENAGKRKTHSGPG